MLICKICGKEYKNFFGLGTHISQGHKIHTKDYYDKYLKKENEGKCLQCQKNTNFLNMNLGYFEFCSQLCSAKSDKVKIKKEVTLKKHGKYRGYRHGSGRGKHGWYKGYFCDSSYELAFIIFCIDNEIPIQRNVEKFEYKFKGKKCYWIPDFILDNYYIEIKGWLNEQNKAKFQNFKKPLIILFKEDLKGVFDYVKSKYGNDFIKLYEGSPYNQKLNKCIICGSSAKYKCCSKKCVGKCIKFYFKKLRKLQKEFKEEAKKIIK